ncbi:adenosylcobinamide-phosphate synthase CbiB [uncultured Methanocorpusculum sp.]|nr:adenosylcobinamide-phosphate synthase CbiB [uncultured Methanocorpusculum sp.]
MAFGAVILFFGLVIDRLIGDPRSTYHPVALIGRFIGLWGRTNYYHPRTERFIGICGWLLTVSVAILPCLLILLYTPWYISLPLYILALAFCIGWRSLEEHVGAVETALTLGEEEGRKAVGYLVSRDTKNLTFEQIRSGAYESAAENLVDSIIAPIFWFVVFELLFGMGILGAVLFRSANTMDAMLGYKDERIRLGWFPARMDDILAYLPARITGAVLLLIFLLKGRIKQAWYIFKHDRKLRPGFNGGIPMSLIAGGCGVMFEKPGVYQIGYPEQTLEEGGKKIISTIRWCTAISAAIGILLLFLI